MSVEISKYMNIYTYYYWSMHKTWGILCETPGLDREAQHMAIDQIW